MEQVIEGILRETHKIVYGVFTNSVYLEAVFDNLQKANEYVRIMKILNMYPKNGFMLDPVYIQICSRTNLEPNDAGTIYYLRDKMYKSEIDHFLVSYKDELRNMKIEIVEIPVYHEIPSLDQISNSPLA
jgi:hypothetical protein